MDSVDNIPVSESIKLESKDTLPTQLDNLEQSNHKPSQKTELAIIKEIDAKLSDLRDFYPRTDSGNAQLFVKKYKNRIKYDYKRGAWFIWDGTYWAKDESGEIRIKARDAMRDRQKKSRDIENELQQRAEYQWAYDSENKNKITAFLELARSDANMLVDSSEWNRDKNLLCVKNGVVNLVTGELLKPDPAMMITQKTRVEYLPNLEPKLWLTALHNMWGHLPNVVKYISKSLGYSITGHTNEQCFWSMFGFGENGKSILLEVIKEILGDYAYTLPYSAIDLYNRSQISNDIAALVDKRFVACSEMQENCRFNEARIKALTGDESLTVRLLFKEYFTFRPVAKLWTATNHKPIIIDASHGFWRRMRLLELSKIFDKSKDRIEDLKYRLLAEESEAILSWLVNQAKSWYMGRLQTPDEIIFWNETYRNDQDLLYEFLSEYVIRTDDARDVIPTAWLYETYIEHATKTHERYKLTKREFTNRLLEKGWQKAKKRPDWREYWLGVKLTNFIVPTETNQQAEDSKDTNEKPTVN